MYIDEIRKNVDEEIYEDICKLLIKNNLTISTVESCTGGMIASTIINYPGASKCFLEGCVTYSNEAKINRVNVKKDTLDMYTSVSEDVAKEMAIGMAKTSNTDISISTTGIAGPDTFSQDKPVGLVYIGIYINREVYISKLRLTGSRQDIRKKATLIALNELKNKIKEIYN